MTTTYTPGTLRDQIVELAARPEGVSNKCLKDILGMPEDHVPPTTQALEYQGRVVRAKAQGHKLRWFKHVADRDAWLARMKAERGTEAEIAARALQARKDARKRAGDKRRADKLARSLRPAVSATATAAAAARSRGQVAPDALPGSVYTAGSSKTAPRVKGDPIITEDTIITLVPCLAVQARWQAQPSQPAVDGFTALGIGRYL